MENLAKINLKLALQITIPFTLFTIISLHISKNTLTPTPTRRNKSCDLFTGEWVPNPEGPYYTNESCRLIQLHRNCMKYGRPDTEYMRWRWKPDGCELPIFDSNKFLEIVKGKSIAFVGDSVARNHAQSLLCLLSQVENPRDVSDTTDENFKLWYFTTHNFTLAMYWSPFLVKTQQRDPHDKPKKGSVGLFLDEPDEAWKTQITGFDYVIISAGHWWFYRPIMYYENNSFTGCLHCPIKNATEYSLSYGYQNAFRTAFRGILENEGFKGVVYMRTFAPSHFEGGRWDDGGKCSKQKPYKRDEINLEGENLEMYTAQMKAFREAQRLGLDRGLMIELMDMTRIMLMRPDGHPSKYWYPANVSWGTDCVHWCLPGPIDNWNDFLLEILED